MSLHSVTFLLLFLPTVLLACTLIARTVPSFVTPLLCCASLIFYAWADPQSFPLLIGSIAFNYLAIRVILRVSSHRRLLAGLAVVANLLPLIFYKYLHAAPQRSTATGLSIVAGIPLGLSFYTFQQITALYDCQKKDAPRLNLLQHALFTSFFAQIVAGPITRYRDLAPQILSLGRGRISARTICAGISLFFIGLGKKLLLADPVAAAAAPIHLAVAAGRPITCFEAWFAGWAFVLQVYFDFSGYSDMAISVASCFGITLAVNFNSPLKARSGSDFVDRWHMSLVAWVREYLFQPVFDFVRRHVKGSVTLRGTLGWIVATIVSMSVIGAWHGSRLILLFGGALGGVLLVLLQLRNLLWPSHRKPAADRGWARRTLTRIALLATLIIVGMTVKVDSFRTFLVFLSAMFDWRTLALPQVLHNLPLVQHLGIPFQGMLPNNGNEHFAEAAILLATLIVLCLPNTMQIFGRLPFSNTVTDTGKSFLPVWQPTIAWGCFIGILMVAEIVFGSHGEGFVYARY